ncbi:hypothetical protein CLF_104234 [Clonorchis sinensis]|uniref:Uncharacterized protein n=1 Tax=Clonorchis sinensis TaxID=79923 RepID=H2KQL4_CLOSI|nr:hypothetical protein CLF_104234 [Clonorchis sinensis]
MLVVDQVAVDLFAELGNWLANVSSPYEETSSVRQARRTDQRPPDQQPINSPELPIFQRITTVHHGNGCSSWVVDAKTGQVYGGLKGLDEMQSFFVHLDIITCLKEKPEAVEVDLGRAHMMTNIRKTKAIVICSMQEYMKEPCDTEADVFSGARRNLQKHPQKVGKLLQAAHTSLARSNEGHRNQLHLRRWKLKQPVTLTNNGPIGPKKAAKNGSLLNQPIKRVVFRVDDCHRTSQLRVNTSWETTGALIAMLATDVTVEIYVAQWYIATSSSSFAFTNPAGRSVIQLERTKYDDDSEPKREIAQDAMTGLTITTSTKKRLLLLSLDGRPHSHRSPTLKTPTGCDASWYDHHFPISVIGDGNPECSATEVIWCNRVVVTVGLLACFSVPSATAVPTRTVAPRLTPVAKAYMDKETREEESIHQRNSSSHNFMSSDWLRWYQQTLDRYGGIRTNITDLYSCRDIWLRPTQAVEGDNFNEDLVQWIVQYSWPRYHPKVRSREEWSVRSDRETRWIQMVTEMEEGKILQVVSPGMFDRPLEAPCRTKLSRVTRTTVYSEKKSWPLGIIFRSRSHSVACHFSSGMSTFDGNMDCDYGTQISLKNVRMYIAYSSVTVFLVPMTFHPLCSRTVVSSEFGTFLTYLRLPGGRKPLKVRFLYSTTSERVRVYADLPKAFEKRYPTKISLSVLCYFIVDVILRLEGLQNPGLQITADEDLVDLEYAGDVILISEDKGKAQALLNKLQFADSCFRICSF